MTVKALIKRNTYYDSVTLMTASSAIDALPGIYRAAFVLREAEGLAMPEVAECLEISEVAVRARVHRARVLLRRVLYQRTGATTASAFAFHLTRCDRVVAGVFARLGLPTPVAGPATTVAAVR